MNKIIKPKSCDKCPVVKLEKGTLICGVAREFKAKATEPIEKLVMWRNCPLNWDKE